MIRSVPLVAGLLILAVLWLGPLPHAGHSAFTAHMIMHVGVLTAAAPLLALSSPALRRHLCASPLAGSAVLASIAEFAAVWAWHSPALHLFARHHPLGLVAEQGTFLAVGVWLWAAALPPPEQEERRGAAVIGLLLTSMHMTLLGTLLALAPRPLYHASAGGHALADQQLGGTIMLAAAGSVYLLVALWQLARLLRGEEQAPTQG